MLTGKINRVSDYFSYGKGSSCVKCILDESVSYGLAEVLRNKGYSVTAIAESSTTGIADTEVFKLVAADSAVLIRGKSRGHNTHWHQGQVLNYKFPSKKQRPPLLSSILYGNNMVGRYSNVRRFSYNVKRTSLLPV